MKKKQRWLCLATITMLIFNMIVPASATTQLQPISENVVMLYNGHGEFVKTASNTASILNSLTIETAKVGDVIFAEEINGSDMYRVEENIYLTQAYGSTYLLTERIMLDANTFSNNQEIFEEYDVPANLREEIRAVIEEQAEMGNDDMEIFLYAPAHSVPETNTQIMADEPLGTVYYNYNYNGTVYRMKDYSVKFYPVATGMTEVAGGTTALNKAKSLKNFIMNLAGNFISSIDLFGLFESAYDVYVNYHGIVSGSTTSDQVCANLQYARILKQTYAPDLVMGDYPNAGCVSHKIWLEWCDIYQYFSTVGKSLYYKTDLNTEHYSPNFRNPAPVAIANGSSSFHIDSYYTVKVLDKTFILNGT
jgi:hypothetical protein